MTKKADIVSNRFSDIKEILGKKFVKGSIDNSFDFIHLANKKIAAQTIDNFRKRFNLSINEVAEMLNTSEASIYRWIKVNKKLDRNIAVQLFELTHLFLYGTEVFENEANLFKWLNLPNTALGELLPINLISIPGGIEKVKTILGRIEYGVYS